MKKTIKPRPPRIKKSTPRVVKVEESLAQKVHGRADANVEPRFEDKSVDEYAGARECFRALLPEHMWETARTEWEELGGVPTFTKAFKDSFDRGTILAPEEYFGAMIRRMPNNDKLQDNFNWFYGTYFPDMLYIREPMYTWPWDFETHRQYVHRFYLRHKYSRPVDNTKYEKQVEVSWREVNCVAETIESLLEKVNKLEEKLESLPSGNG